MLKQATEMAKDSANLVKQAVPQDTEDILIDSVDHFASDYYNKLWNRCTTEKAKMYVKDMLEKEAAEDRAAIEIIQDLKEAKSSYDRAKIKIDSVKLKLQKPGLSNKQKKEQNTQLDDFEEKAKIYSDFIKLHDDSLEYFKSLSTHYKTKYHNTLDAARAKVRLLNIWNNRLSVNRRHLCRHQRIN